MRKKLGIVFMTVGALLVISALGLLLYNQLDAARADRAAQSVLEKIQQTITDDSALTDTPELSYEMKTMEIDGYDYIGFLTLPSIHLTLPIMAEWDYTRMKIAPCLYYGSVKSDDMVIAGHGYQRHFGRLKELKVGDELCFSDADNKKYLYVVGAIEVLPPTATEEMINSDFDLSLYTCTYGGRERLTVRCQRIE